MGRTCFALVASLALAACSDSVTGPSVPAGQQFQLRAGEAATLEGTGLVVRFDAVAQDSRCPADVVCVTMGDAEAVFSLGAGGTSAATVGLHTQPGQAQKATVGEWTLTLIHLDPYPYSSRPIAPGDYRASLRVDRASGS